MWYTVEIIKKIKPKYIIWENVKNVLSDKHKHNFDKYLEILRDSGYKNHSKVINAKHWGIPQNRERVFVVSIREDINKDFKFPISSLKSQQSLFNTNVIDIEPKILADILENEVDEKYYLSDEYMERFIKSLDDEKLQDKILNNIIGTTQNKQAKGANSSHWIYDINFVVGTLAARDYKQLKQILEYKTCITSKRNEKSFKDVEEPIFNLISQNKHRLLELN